MKVIRLTPKQLRSIINEVVNEGSKDNCPQCGHPWDAHDGGPCVDCDGMCNEVPPPLKSSKRRSVKEVVEGKDEKCPHCGNEFSTDYYPTPGRVECPSCGYDFDAEHDEDYNADMGYDTPVG